MAMQGMGCPPARNQSRAAGASSDAKPGIVPTPSGKAVAGKVPSTDNGHKAGSAIGGFSGGGVKGGFVK